MLRLSPAFLVLASCVVVRPPEPNPGTEVRIAVDEMYADLSARRWDALGAHFLPGASLAFSTDTGVTRMAAPEFIEMVRKNTEGKEIFEERMAKAWIRVYEDLAVVWSSFEGRIGNGDKIKVWSGVDAFTLMKVDGRWKISHIAVFKDPEPDKY